MLSIIYKRQKFSSSFKGALKASGVMAFASLGDAILYPILPVYGSDLGFSAFFIGALLSVNRFVRIIFNTHIANMINGIGMKKMLIYTSMLAVITTFMYGLQFGAILFLLARILWGLSYSGLKISTLSYASKAKENSGLAFGLTTAIKSLGGLSILFFGSKLVAVVGIQKGLFIIGAISFLGVILAYTLPDIQSLSKPVKTKSTFYPSVINLMVFLLALTIDGITVVTLNSLIGTSTANSETLILVALYLFIKKLFIAVFSVVSGIVSTKISTIKMFTVAVLCCVVALVFIAYGYSVTGIIIAFLFNTIVVTFSPLVAIELQKGTKNSLQAISSVSTWWDLGAAIGAFIGILAANSLGVKKLYLLLSTILLILFILYSIKILKSKQGFK